LETLAHVPLNTQPNALDKKLPPVVRGLRRHLSREGHSFASAFRLIRDWNRAPGVSRAEFKKAQVELLTHLLHVNQQAFLVGLFRRGASQLLMEVLKEHEERWDRVLAQPAETFEEVDAQGARALAEIFLGVEHANAA
jgi:hypothetical protein